MACTSFGISGNFLSCYLLDSCSFVCLCVSVTLVLLFNISLLFVWMLAFRLQQNSTELLISAWKTSSMQNWTIILLDWLLFTGRRLPVQARQQKHWEASVVPMILRWILFITFIVKVNWLMCTSILLLSGNCLNLALNFFCFKFLPFFHLYFYLYFILFSCITKTVLSFFRITTILTTDVQLHFEPSLSTFAKMTLCFSRCGM